CNLRKRCGDRYKYGCTSLPVNSGSAPVTGCFKTYFWLLPVTIPNPQVLFVRSACGFCQMSCKIWRSLFCNGKKLCCGILSKVSCGNAICWPFLLKLTLFFVAFSLVSTNNTTSETTP